MIYLILIALQFLFVDGKVEWELVNYAKREIWIGIISLPGKELLMNGGFALERGNRIVFTSEQDWAGRFWVRTWCNTTTQHCQTGDCNDKLECNGNGAYPPATQIEFNLSGNHGFDYYDISLVDGFNIGVAVQPLGGTGIECQTLVCTADLIKYCPKHSQVIGGNGNDTIACKSDCIATRSDKDCCTGAYSDPSKCKPGKTAKIFKKYCPNAYSYSYDDATSVYICSNTRRFVITAFE